VLRVEVIAPSPLLAGGLSNFPAIVKFSPTSCCRGSADIDPLLADTHAFEELRLLSQLRSRPTTLNGAVRSAEALVAQYSYTPDASPQR
jgi:hypothetical protein